MFSKRVFVAAAALLVGSAAFAQNCPCSAGTRVDTAEAIATLLGNKTVCAAASNNNDTWQEFHSGSTTAGGPLIDYKLGPGHPVDPSEQVGTWSVIGGGATRTGASVVHNYGAGGTYTYLVCQSAGTVSFCGGSGRSITGATLRTGQVSCGATARSSR